MFFYFPLAFNKLTWAHQIPIELSSKDPIAGTSNMPAPSPLSIATSSVQRLVKEETYYHKDLASQQVRIEKLEKDIKEHSADLDENADYVLKQEVSHHQRCPLFS